jgi:hypothetical protein
MTIEMRIEKSLVGYNNRAMIGIPPKKILVGREEAAILFEKAKIRTGQVFTRASEYGDRLEFRGMAVYVVDQESYLWFAP